MTRAHDISDRLMEVITEDSDYRYIAKMTELVSDEARVLRRKDLVKGPVNDKKSRQVLI